MNRKTAIIVLVALFAIGVTLLLGTSAPSRVAGWSWGEDGPVATAMAKPAGWKWHVPGSTREA